MSFSQVSGWVVVTTSVFVVTSFDSSALRLSCLPLLDKHEAICCRNLYKTAKIIRIKIPSKIFDQNGNCQLVSNPILWKDLTLSMNLIYRFQGIYFAFVRMFSRSCNDSNAVLHLIIFKYRRGGSSLPIFCFRRLHFQLR